MQLKIMFCGWEIQTREAIQRLAGQLKRAELPGPYIEYVYF